MNSESPIINKLSIIHFLWKNKDINAIIDIALEDEIIPYAIEILSEDEELKQLAKEIRKSYAGYFEGN